MSRPGAVIPRGQDSSTPVLSRAREVLIDYDERVAHYEIIAEAHGAARPN